MAETWDESKPAGSRSPTLGDDDIREFKRSMRERLAEDHDFEATESPAFGAGGGYTIGKHKFITLVQRNTSKVTAADEVAFVCKAVSGNPEVLLTPPSAGSDRQITKNAGLNINLNSGDFENYLIKAGFYNTGSIDGDDVAAYGIKAANLDTGSVATAKIPALAITSALLDSSAISTEKIADAAVTIAKLASFESAGDSGYYYSTHNLGGASLTTQALSWTKLVEARCVLKGTYRFYWGYKQDYDNVWGYWRVLKNGGLLLGSISDKGTSGSDPFHYRTDDITLAAGDLLEFQAYVSNASGTAQTNVWLRGQNRTGLLEEI